MPAGRIKDDARFRRSRAALHRVVIELATERDIDRITAAEIAAAAGVNRSTFYEHAGNPASLLRDALGADLDDLRERHLAQTAPGEAPQTPYRSTVRMLQHLTANAAIYRRAFGGQGDSAGLTMQLIDKFETLTRALVEQGIVTLSGPQSRHPETAYRYIAAGYVGAMQTWLAQEPAEPIEQFAQTLLDLLPGWWQEVRRPSVGA